MKSLRRPRIPCGGRIESEVDSVEMSGPGLLTMKIMKIMETIVIAIKLR